MKYVEELYELGNRMCQCDLLLSGCESQAAWCDNVTPLQWQGPLEGGPQSLLVVGMFLFLVYNQPTGSLLSPHPAYRNTG